MADNEDSLAQLYLNLHINIISIMCATAFSDSRSNSAHKKFSTVIREIPSFSPLAANISSFVKCHNECKPYLKSDELSSIHASLSIGSHAHLKIPFLQFYGL